MPESKLKPCPFCGSAAKIRIDVVRGMTDNCIRYFVFCPECGIGKYRDLASGISYDTGDAILDEAIEDWNKRIGTDNIAIKPDIYGDGYDDNGNMIYDMYDCPECGKSYELDYEKYDYCPSCGQKFDWDGIDNEAD